MKEVGRKGSPKEETHSFTPFQPCVHPSTIHSSVLCICLAAHIIHSSWSLMGIGLMSQCWRKGTELDKALSTSPSSQSSNLHNTQWRKDRTDRNKKTRKNTYNTRHILKNLIHQLNYLCFLSPPSFEFYK